MTQSELEKYKNCVTKRLSELSPFLQQYALGDFSEEIEIPEKEDEFTELLVSIRLMADDLKEMNREKENTIVQTRKATEDLQRRNSELTALYETTLDITRTHELPDLLNTIVKRAGELLDGTGGGLYLCEQDHRQVRCVVSYKTKKDYTDTVLAYGEGAAGKVAATGEPLIIDDYRKWTGRAEVYDEDQPFNAVISVPMLWQGQVTGVISVLREEKRKKFTLEDLRLLTSMANQAALAIENTRLYEETKKLVNYNENIIQSMAEGIVEYDADGFFSFVNPAALRLLGYTADELIGLHWSTVIPLEQHSIVQATQERRRRGETDRYDLELVRKDGKRISVQVSDSPKLDAEGQFFGTLAVFTDITERVRAERALLEKEEKLKEAQKIAKLGHYIYDIKNDSWTSSDELNDIFGIEEDYKKDATGWLQIVHPASRETMSDYLQNRVLKQHQKFDKEYRIINRKTGQVKWVHGLGSLTFDEKKNPIEMLGTIQDITERKQAEAERQQNHNLLKAILDGAQDVIFVKDAKGRYMISNPVRNQILSLSENEVLGKDDTAFYPPKIARQLMDADRHILEDGKSMIGEQEIITLSGDSRTFLSSKHPWRDGQGHIIGIIGIAHDITERKLAEQALKESEERYRSLVDNAFDGIYLMCDKHYEYVNDRFCEITGYSRREIISEQFDFNVLLTGEGKDIVQARYQARKRGEEIPSTYETQIKTKKGDQRDVEISTVALGLKGEMRILGIFRDITERKRAERKIQERQRFLEGVLTAAPDAIVTLNDDSIVTGWNRGAEELFQYATSEAIGKNIDDLITHGDPVIYKEATDFSNQVSIKKPVGPIETIRYRKDGTPINVILAGSPILINEEFEGSVAVYTDITERIQVEKQLQQYANNVEALLEIENTISSSLDLDEVLKNIMTELQKVIPYDSISLQILQGRSLEIIACRGIALSDETTGVLFPLDPKFPNYRVIEEKKTLAFDDITRKYPHFVDEADKYESGHIRSWLGVPLISKEIVTGMITMDRSEILPFSVAEIQLASAIAGQAALAIENARLFSESRQRLERLSSLRQIDQAITNNMDLRVTLDILLGHILRQLEVDAAAILLYRSELQNLEFVAGMGFRTQALQHTNLRLGEGHAGKAALERRTVKIHNLAQQHTGYLRSPDFRNEKFIAYIGIPLIAKGNIIGVLEIYNRRPLSSDTEWMAFLETLAGQAAIAIDNVNLFQNLQKLNVGLIQAYDATIEGWAQALEMRDMETEGHSRRVVEMTTELAQTMGISGENLTHIRRGAQLHDIGKMAVPDVILQKPGKLSVEEWEIMRKHPVYAINWLSNINYLRPALDIPYCHHEKWDGTGYPRGLKGQEIPIAARIFSIIDVWDALRSDRPYRNAWSKEKTLTYINEQSGNQFDPNVVVAFIKMLEENPDFE